jgi:hypothetical protein
MKKIIALIVSLIMLAGSASVLAEAEGKVTIGTISINGVFTLQCGLPEGYHPVPTSVTPEQVTAAIRSDDPLAPVMYLSVAYDEKYYDVDRMNDLTPEELTQLEETYIEEDPEVEITYGETGYGTQLLIARHETEELDFIAFFSIYKGYCVEFVLAPSEQAEDRNLTEEQLRLSIDFLTDLDFIPANIPADPKTLVADGKYVTNISDYDPETRCITVRRTETEGGYVVEKPKTRAGFRRVFLPEAAVWLMDEVRKYTIANKEDYIFFEIDHRKPANTPHRIRNCYFLKHLYKVCDDMQIPRRSCHACRKTYASILRDNKLPEKYIVETMGHTNITTTDRYYAKPIAEASTRQQLIDSVADFEILRPVTV